MQSVLVLGATGMLGSMVLDMLSQETNLSVSATARTAVQCHRGSHQYPHVKWFEYHAGNAMGSTCLVADFQWVINCVGITKPYIHDDNPSEVERAIRVNALWPHQLAREVSGAKHRLLQIATDCVFSGQNGPYAEPSHPDAHDVYGRTKALGEARYPGVTNLRTSIIGPEPGAQKFLLEWVRSQAFGVTLKGFTDHYWNGVTTLQFARICHGIIQTQRPLDSLVHVIPKDVINKHELLQIIARAYGRPDLMVEALASPHKNMTLATHRPEVNKSLWTSAGYHEIPTIEQMVQEVAAYKLQPDCVTL